MKQTSILISESLIRRFLDRSWGKFSQLEALAYLFRMISASSDQKLHTSVNHLAKTWNWDNHVAEGFIVSLINDNIIELGERESKTLCIKLRSETKETLERHPYLFSLLKSSKKLSKSEAFFYLASVIMHKKGSLDVMPSYRSMGQVLGWDHHSVKSFLDTINFEETSLKDVGNISHEPSCSPQ